MFSQRLWLRAGVRGLLGGNGVLERDLVGVRGISDIEVVDFVRGRGLDSDESWALYFLTFGEAVGVSAREDVTAWDIVHNIASSVESTGRLGICERVVRAAIWSG